MKHNPQSLTPWMTGTAVAVSAVAVALSAIIPVSVLAQQDAGAAAIADEATTEKPTVPQLTKSDLSADQAFERVAETLEGLDTMSCDITQQVVLSGQRFQAVGRYAQASGNRMRLEYRIFPATALKADDAESFKLDGQTEDTSKTKVTGSLEQVSDGSVLWSKWINGPQKTLTRRNIQEIMDAVEDVPSMSSTQTLQSLGVGGMQTLMAQLQLGMDFGEVREQTVGDAKLLVLAGRWNEKTLAALKASANLPNDPNVPLPEYIPDYVRVYIDADANLPRRIQYLKKSADSQSKRVRPVVTLDFRNIKLNDDVPDSTFEFVRDKDEEIAEEDLTQPVIDAIKKIAASPPEGGEAETDEAAAKD